MLSYFWQDESAMSLIEVMVGITILTLTLLTMLNFFTGSTKIIGQSETRTEALRLARTEMDKIQADFNSNRQEEDFNFADFFNDIETTDKEEIIESSFKKSISTSEYNSDSDLRLVNLAILWDNEEKKVELKTLFANLGDDDD